MDIRKTDEFWAVLEETIFIKIWHGNLVSLLSVLISKNLKLSSWVCRFGDIRPGDYKVCMYAL